MCVRCVVCGVCVCEVCGVRCVCVCGVCVCVNLPSSWKMGSQPGRGTGCPHKYQPNEGLCVALISVRTLTDVPAAHSRLRQPVCIAFTRLEFSHVLSQPLQRSAALNVTEKCVMRLAHPSSPVCTLVV